jgi:8-oxo-dGTP diphosphatase
MLSKSYGIMFELIVRAIIQNEQGDILLVKRVKEPAKDRWILPGGKIEFHEKAEGAISREIKEELGLDFFPQFLGYKEDFKSVKDRHCMVLYFLGTNKGEIKTKQDEISEARYFSAKDIQKSKEIGFDHKDVLKTFIKARG